VCSPRVYPGGSTDVARPTDTIHKFQTESTGRVFPSISIDECLPVYDVDRCDEIGGVWRIGEMPSASLVKLN
jgi:hypothetical protein